ncbi:MAG: S8 family serine peptidase [Sphingomonadales bacterium]
MVRPIPTKSQLASVVSAALCFTGLMQTASAQMEAHMRSVSTDRAQQLHNAAHNMAMHHRQAAMMRATTAGGYGGQSRMAMMPGVERLSSRQGDFYVRSGEIVGLDLTLESRAIIADLGLSISRSERLDRLDMSVDVIALPIKRSVRSALKKLRRADPDVRYVPNALFNASEGAEVNARAASAAMPRLAPGFPQGAARIGLIDTAIDEQLLSESQNVRVKQRKFGPGEALLPRRHGTTVAIQAIRSGARDLVVADVFSNETGFADAEGIIRALDWMAGEDLSVINLSLTGPDNLLLERAIKALLKRGHIVVAAVGNDGPNKGPAFPAAYPRVIGVTAVDSGLEIYRNANAGPGVDVAAIGVGVAFPAETSVKEGQDPVSGTSFAAPVVAAILSQEFTEPMSNAADAALAYIDETAMDLGPPGKDPLFGAGAIFAKSAAAPVKGDLIN